MTAGIGAIIYYKFRDSLAFISQYWFIGICGALGTAAQQCIQGVLDVIFKPIFKYLWFHEKLYELNSLERQGKISAQKKRELIDKLCEKRFLE